MKSSSETSNTNPTLRRPLLWRNAIYTGGLIVLIIIGAALILKRASVIAALTGLFGLPFILLLQPPINFVFLLLAGTFAYSRYRYNRMEISKTGAIRVVANIVFLTACTFVAVVGFVMFAWTNPGNPD